MLQTVFKSIVVPLRDFIYPPVCFTCDRLLNENESRVCAVCWDSLERLQPDHPAQIEIRKKFKSEELVQDLLSCFLFEKEGKLQEIVQLLKYGGIRSLGVRLGKEIGERIQNNSEFASSDYLIPVPLHKLKQRERGYNQSEYLCRGISELTGIPVHTSLMVRNKYTESQTQLDIEQRQKNVGGAFAINPKRRLSVQAKSFIIVDDVITTGSTINACASVLRRGGASVVYAASAALAK